MRIDCHAHLLPAERMAKLIRWTVRRCNPAHPVPEAVTLEALLEEYRQVGVDHVWNFAHAIFPEETAALNAWNQALGARDSRILPFGTCHPLVADPLGVVDRCLGEYGFVGMKFHPFVQRFTPWQARYFPIWERIARHGPRILVFHTGFEQFYGGALPLDGFAAIAAAVPEVSVVLAHANYPWVGQAFELVARFPNLYVDTVHLFGRITAGWDARVAQPAVWAELRRGLAAFPDRVLFGTDHPSGTGTLAGMYRDVEAFGLAPEVAAAVLGGTARRLVERVRPLAPAGPPRYNS